MKQDELDAIRARCEAATPGPWGQHRRRVAGLYIENMVLREDEISICRDLCVEDAAFIAHARADVPALLDEIERLRDEVANLDAEPTDVVHALIVVGAEDGDA